MTPEPLDWWQRAKVALDSAVVLAESDPDGSASRAYYAAFFAVSALFALEGRSFSRHSAVEAAVHRDLVNAGRWPPQCGADYSALNDLRRTGDYGGDRHVSHADALAAVNKARAILDAVRKAAPEPFPE